MLILNNHDVMQVLDMNLTLRALDGVFQELVRGDAGGMGRIDLYVPSGSSDAPYSFLNVGAIGAQFEAVAAQVYEKARDKGLGQEIPTDWFLQDTRD